MHYYDRKSRQELDFLLAEHYKVTIIEVKSGDTYKRHASVDTALKEQPEKIGKVMVMNKFNFEKTDNILYVPLYMAAFV